MGMSPAMLELIKSAKNRYAEPLKPLSVCGYCVLTETFEHEGQRFVRYKIHGDVTDGADDGFWVDSGAQLHGIVDLIRYAAENPNEALRLANYLWSVGDVIDEEMLDWG